MSHYIRWVLSFSIRPFTSMLITNLIIHTFAVELTSKVFFEKNANKIQQIFTYSFSDKYTVCYIANYGTAHQEFRIDGWIPVVVLDPKGENGNVKFCHGYIIIVRKLGDFLEILSSFRFPPHKKVLLFLEEEYHSTRLIQTRIYEMALTLIVIHGFHNAQNYHNDPSEVNMKIYFAMHNKTKVLGKDEIVRGEFSTKWTPALWSNIGRSIRVSLFHCPPYIMVKYGSNHTAYTLNGIDFDIFQNIAKDWPVQFVLEEEKENTRDNLFIKIIEKVVNKESDIAMCGLWQRVILEKKLKMSKYNSAQCITFLVAKPTLLGDETFLFQPFSSVLWLCMFAILCTVYLLKNIINRFETKSKVSVLDKGKFHQK